MKLIIASNNVHKIEEIKKILGTAFHPIVSLQEENITCDPKETGATFAENALIKAKEISRYSSSAAVLADDTGLCVDALNGAPGVLSARYAQDHNSEANRKKLLKKLSGKNDRSAHFETAVVLILPNGQIKYANGRVDGHIMEKEDGGVNGFGYDCIFFCDELNKSFGVATQEEKNSVSHRARALRNLLAQL